MLNDECNKWLDALLEYVPESDVEDVRAILEKLSEYGFKIMCNRMEMNVYVHDTRGISISESGKPYVSVYRGRARFNSGDMDSASRYIDFYIKHFGMKPVAEREDDNILSSFRNLK